MMDTLIARLSKALWGPQLSLPAPSSETKFCKRCEKIDLAHIFYPERPLLTQDGQRILYLGIIDGNSKCPLCRLFAAVHFQDLNFKDREGFHLCLYSISTLVGEEQPATEWPGIGLSIVRGAGLSRTVDMSSFMDNPSYTNKGFILPAAGTIAGFDSRAPMVGCVVNPDTVDYTRIKGWLSDCHVLHSSCDLSKAFLPVQLKCIDCNTGKISRIEFRDEYVCLSYVWGAVNQRCPDKIGEDYSRLPSDDIPRVIEDAITLVKKIRMRYLWVDRYCIDQTDHDSKNIQIQNMDHIYECAHLTIIACAGSDSTFGLPGVGTTPRKAQPTVVTNNGTFVSTLPPLAPALRDSAWIRRGWTYQEAILSRRCLFFTDVQVYFVCRGMTCSESIERKASRPMVIPRNPIRTLRSDIFGRSRVLSLTQYSQLRQLADHITEYSSRELTYQEDALNAFRGLLTRSPFPTYYGIPIAATDHPEDLHSQATWHAHVSEADWNIGLARGLYWTPQFFKFSHRTHLTRRHGFPSWSWVGWKGAVGYCSEGGPNTGLSGDEELMAADRERFDTKIWVEDDQGLAIPTTKLLATSGSHTVMREVSPCLGLEAWVFQLRLQPRGDDIHVCSCHPNSKHEGKWLENSSIGRVYSDEASPKGSKLFNRLTTRFWDCVLLFESSGQSSILRNLLIIEYTGKSIQGIPIVQRVGTVSIARGMASPSDYAFSNDALEKGWKEKKRFRLI